MQSIFAADIGGTNGRFALFRRAPGKELTLAAQQQLPTAGAGSFAELLQQLGDSDFPVPGAAADMAVIAVAGPIERGRYCKPPNIAWDIDLTSEACAGFPRRTVLINDFVAQAWACRSPLARQVRVVLSGEPVAGSVVGVIGAGTGLGKAIIASLPNGTDLVIPSEGGHCLFPFVSEREFAFQRFCRERTGRRHIIGDLVVSGSGLRFIHCFLTGQDLTPGEVSACFSSAPETLTWAARFYGRACRDHVLASLATGGLYLVGGLAARAPEIVFHDEFRREFHDDPDMGRLLKRVPVWLIDDQDSGLWGAAFYGTRLLDSEEV